MNTVTISVASRETVNQRMADAVSAQQGGAYISFVSAELLWKILTPKRWEILTTMTGQGELAIREVARRVGRDVKAVHGDITALIKARIVERGESGVIFPYDAVHVDFTISKAA